MDALSPSSVSEKRGELTGLAIEIVLRGSLKYAISRAQAEDWEGRPRGMLRSGLVP